MKLYLVASELIEEDDRLLLDYFERVLLIILQIDLLLEELIHHCNVFRKRQGDVQLRNALQIVGDEEIDVSKELLI